MLPTPFVSFFKQLWSALKSAPKTAQNFLHNFLLAQAVVTWTSLPFLYAWGLPVSIMTMVGNLVMTPLLICFIFLSSLIMTTELCVIPNSFLYESIETLTTFWVKVLHWGKPSWLIPLSWNLLIVLMVGSLLTGHLAYKHRPRWLAGALLAPFLLLLAPNTMLEKIASPYGQTAIFYKNRGKLFVHYDSCNRLTIDDKGFFSRCSSAESAITFDVKPQLAQRFGTWHIENLNLNKISIRTVQMAEALCRNCTIKTIRFDPKLCKKYDNDRSQASFNQAWDQLKSTAFDQKTSM